MWKAKLSKFYKKMPEDVFLTWSEAGKGILRQKKRRSWRKRLVCWLHPKFKLLCENSKAKRPAADWEEMFVMQITNKGLVSRTHIKKSRINKKMKTTVEKQKKTFHWRRNQINLWKGWATSPQLGKCKLKQDRISPPLGWQTSNSEKWAQTWKNRYFLTAGLMCPPGACGHGRGTDQHPCTARLQLRV